MELARCLDAVDHQLAQRSFHACDRRLAGRCEDDELREHRIVREPDDAAHHDAAVPAHSWPARDMQIVDATGRREESVGRILTRDATLDRPSTGCGHLGEVQRLTSRDAELPLHEIDAHHQLGDRVFDLNAGVHLKEVELPVLRQQELARTRVHIAGRARRCDRRITHPLAQLGRYRDARRLLDHLLVPALDRAFAFAERDAVAVHVGEDLDLDVPRPLDVLLHVDRVVTEGILGLALRRGERRRDLTRFADEAHAFAATACGGLEQHRISESCRDLRGLRGVAQRLRRAWHHGRTGRDRKRTRGRLGAHRRDRLGRRADPDQSRLAHRAREPLALGEKAVPRMDRVRTDRLCHRDDVVALQVALARRRRSDPHGFVGLAHVGRVRVGVGIDRDRLDPEFLACPDHAQRDLSTIGDQDFADRPSDWSRRAQRLASAFCGHSGMQPCFFAGFFTRFPLSISSASIRRGRVSRGSMMSSTYPRPAATYGLANFSAYSATRASIAA